ncbi:FK506-binding protein 5-like protein [Cinnamomum micranthum f. kanehirae]|uniref:FK506-binding protein 5-like protein n=1 Tax=Cinnamomum micranthum f. kanehirae TaxID=337451 RepID=A0A3S3NUX8_9MAGN|nr:FK506-binding protein 5-like protein [Cinnamomum micranthum f. kanehirae]RWR98062.1 FK506-binding protein 5-like protein [Cinnamomum micranthum f. kanehirae]
MSLPYDFYLSLLLESVILDLILNYTITGESRMGYVADQEARVERAVIHAIVTGDTAWLRPNSGRPVMIGGHNINVQCHGDRGDDYRVWEWHGHVMTYDEENGYSLDYIFGHFYERIPERQE